MITQLQIVEWILYGMAAALTLTLSIIGFLIVYTVKSLKETVNTIQESCEELTESLTDLIEEFKVSKAITIQQFEYSKKQIENLESSCKVLEHDVNSLKANDTENRLKLSNLESKINLLARNN